MIVNKREYEHNTPEQVRDYLTAALNLITDLDPPTDLRTAAFTKAVDLFSSKQIVMEQQAPFVPPMLGGNGRI